MHSIEERVRKGRDEGGLNGEYRRLLEDRVERTREWSAGDKDKEIDAICNTRLEKFY